MAKTKKTQLKKVQADQSVDRVKKKKATPKPSGSKLRGKSAASKDRSGKAASKDRSNEAKKIAPATEETANLPKTKKSAKERNVAESLNDDFKPTRAKMKGKKAKEDTKSPAPPTKAVKKKALTPRKKRTAASTEKSTSDTPSKSEEKKVTKSDDKKAAKKVIKSDKVKKGVVGKKGKDPEEKVKVAVKKRRRKIDKGIMARRKLERMKKAGFLTPPPRRSAALNASAIMNCMLDMGVQRIKAEPPDVEEDVDLLEFEQPPALDLQEAIPSSSLQQPSKVTKAASQKKSKTKKQQHPVKKVIVKRARHARNRIRNIDSADWVQGGGEDNVDDDDVIIDKRDSDLDKSPPKLRDSRKVLKKRKKLKRRGEKKQQAEIKDFIVGRRMASMNASAMMNATYSQKWTRKDPLKMAIEASLRDVEGVKEEPMSPSVPDEDLDNEDMPDERPELPRSSKSGKTQKSKKCAKLSERLDKKVLLKSSKKNVIKPIKSVKEKVIKKVKRRSSKPVSIPEQIEPVIMKEKMKASIDRQSSLFESLITSSNKSPQTESGSGKAEKKVQASTSAPSGSNSSQGQPGGTSLISSRPSTPPLPPLLFTKAIPYEHDQALDQIVAGCFKNFASKSLEDRKLSNPDDPILCSSTPLPATSKDAKQRRLSTDRKSSAGKGATAGSKEASLEDDQESQRQKLIDSVVMKNRIRKISGGKKIGASISLHTKPGTSSIGGIHNNKDGKEVKQTELSDLETAGLNKKRKNADVKTESPTKTLIAPWKTGHHKLNLDVLSSSGGSHRNDLTSKIRGHRNDLTSKMGGKILSKETSIADKKTTLEKSAKKGGQSVTNLPGQKSTNPALTQHVLPSGQTQAPHPVATSLSAGGLATPSLAVTPSPAGMGQPPTATVPPTLLPVNQLPAQVKAPALVGTISPVKQQTMDGLSPNHQYQQLYSSGSMTLPSTVYSTGGPVYTGPYVHAVQPQQNQFYQGNAYSTNPAGTNPQYPGSTAAQYPNQAGGTAAQYNSSSGSAASTSQQPFGNQYGAYYGSNFYSSGSVAVAGKQADGSQQPPGSGQPGGQVAPVPGYPGYYIATPTGNMNFPPGAVAVAVTSGSQFAYQSSSGAVVAVTSGSQYAAYQQAPGGRIIGPIIALAGGMAVSPGSLAGSPQPGVSGQQAANSQETGGQRKQYGSSGKPVLRPSIDGSNKPHGKAAPIMAEPSNASTFKGVGGQHNTAYSGVTSTTDSADYRASSQIYQVTSMQNKGGAFPPQSTSTTPSSHSQQQQQHSFKQPHLTDNLTDKSRQTDPRQIQQTDPRQIQQTDSRQIQQTDPRQMSESGDHKSGKTTYRQIRPKQHHSVSGKADEECTTSTSTTSGSGTNSAGNTMATSRPLQIVGPISGMSTNIGGQIPGGMNQQQQLPGGLVAPGGIIAPGNLVAAVLPQPHIPAQVSILQQPLRHHQPLNIPTITPSARLTAPQPNAATVSMGQYKQPRNAPKSSTPQSQTIGHVSIHPKPSNMHIHSSNSATQPQPSMPRPGFSSGQFSTTITPIHKSGDTVKSSKPMHFQQYQSIHQQQQQAMEVNNAALLPPGSSSLLPTGSSSLPAALQAERCRLLAKNNVTIIPKNPSSPWKQPRELFPSGRPWGAPLLGQDGKVVPPHRKPVPEVVTLEDSPPREEPPPDITITSTIAPVQAVQKGHSMNLGGHAGSLGGQILSQGGHPGLPNGLSRVASSAIQTTKSPSKVTTSKDVKTTSMKRTLSTPDRDSKHAKVVHQVPPVLSPQVPVKPRGPSHQSRISSSFARNAANALVRSQDPSPEKQVSDDECDENISRSRLQLKPATSPKLMIDNYPVVQLSKLKDENKILKSFSSPALPAIASDKVKQEKQERKKKEVKRHSSGHQQPAAPPPPPLVPWSKRSKEAPKNCGGWTWVGKGTVEKVYLHNVDQPIERICYEGIRHEEGDEEVQVRDCILLASGSRKKDLPFIAKVTALWENPDDGEMNMSLLWYYRPEHVEGGRTSDDLPEELFASKHRDHTSVACIEDKCYVLTTNEFCRYKKFCKSLECSPSTSTASTIVPELSAGYPRNRLLPACQVPQDRVFICRKVYDSRCKRMLKNPI